VTVAILFSAVGVKVGSSGAVSSPTGYGLSMVGPGSVAVSER
jgi:hypothetical protein